MKILLPEEAATLLGIRRKTNFQLEWLKQESDTE